MFSGQSRIVRLSASRQKIAASKSNKAERKYVTNQLCLTCEFIFYKFYLLGICKCTNYEFEF